IVICSSSARTRGDMSSTASARAEGTDTQTSAAATSAVSVAFIIAPFAKQASSTQPRAKKEPIRLHAEFTTGNRIGLRGKLLFEAEPERQAPLTRPAERAVVHLVRRNVEAVDTVVLVRAARPEQRHIPLVVR